VSLKGLGTKISRLVVNYQLLVTMTQFASWKPISIADELQMKGASQREQ
jgi:hypothetical protein